MDLSPQCVLYTAIRRDRLDFQSSHPAKIWYVNNNCRLRWKSFTLSCRIIYYVTRPQTHIIPSALLRSISRNRLPRTPANCVPSRAVELRVLLRCLDDAVKRNEPSRPCFKAQRWVSPSIAAPRLRDKGAKLNGTKHQRRSCQVHAKTCAAMHRMMP